MGVWLYDVVLQFAIVKEVRNSFGKAMVELTYEEHICVSSIEGAKQMEYCI